jgi:CheY-like chemotaxis protein
VAAREREADRRAEAEARLSALVDLCAALASGDFSARAEVLGDGSVLDGIATGLNMMADELAARAVQEQEYQRRLLHAARLAAIGQLAASVAHEVNNPGAALLANATSLEAHARELRAALADVRAGGRAGGPDRERLEAALAAHAADGRIADLAELATENAAAARRITDVARALLDAAGVPPHHDAQTTLGAVAEEACKLVDRQVGEVGTLVRRLHPVPAMLADHAKLVQVATHLLLEVLHAPLAPDAERAIEVSTGVEGATALLAVARAGPIGPMVPVTGVAQPVAADAGATLRLAVAAEIVRAHGGELFAGVGAGARYEARFPAPPGTGIPPSATVTEPAPGTAAPARRLRVLLVDDEPGLLASYRRLLGDDHELATATGGAEAIALLERDQGFDAIICDLVMPPVGGAEVMAWAEAHHPTLARRMAISTAGAFTPRAAAFLAQLGDRVAQKPIEPARLRALLRRLAGEG